MKSKLSQEIYSSIDLYFEELISVLRQLDKTKIEKIIEILIKAYKTNKKVFIMGNGGSAANASHMATDFAKGTLSRLYDESEKRFKVYSLTDNVALLTAYGNDLDYSEVFLQQLRNLVEKEMLLLL